MEHLHYFSEENLKYFVEKNGYKVLSIMKTYESTPIPFITMIAEKEKMSVLKIFKTDIQKQKKMFKKYIKITNSRYSKIRKKLKKINNKIPTYLYGAGMTSSSFIFHSSINETLNIKGIFDGNPDKWGLKIGKITVSSYNSAREEKKMKNIVITSEFSINEILNKIKSKYNHIYFYDKKVGIKKY